MSWLARSSVLLSVLVVATTGCSIDLGLDQTTHGSSDTLRFSYAGDELLSCLFGCPLSQPMLEGATVDVMVLDVPAEAKVTARTTGSAAHVVGWTASYTCESKSTKSSGQSRTVEATEPCTTGEKRSVLWSASIAAANRGTSTLEIVDSNGHVLDHTDIEVARATKTVIRRAKDQSDIGSSLSLAIGETVILQPTFSDAAGRDLQKGKDGVEWLFADPDVVGQGEGLDDLFGGAADGVIRGKSAGQSTVTLKVGAVDVPIEVTVTP